MQIRPAVASFTVACPGSTLPAAKSSITVSVVPTSTRVPSARPNSAARSPVMVPATSVGLHRRGSHSFRMPPTAHSSSDQRSRLVS